MREGGRRNKCATGCDMKRALLSLLELLIFRRSIIPIDYTHASDKRDRRTSKWRWEINIWENKVKRNHAVRCTLREAPIETR
jgi:hypothetical protein